MANRNNMNFSEELMRTGEHGFTLIELLIATAVLLVGVVGVAQLVPLSVRSNFNNRYDTAAVVIAQRELDQMVYQGLQSTTFTDADGRVCNLGSITTSNVVNGNPVIMVGNQVAVNFNAAAVAGYNYTFTDPNDAIGIPYEVRWAVISNVVVTKVVSKRYILGAWKREPGRLMGPVTLDVWVQSQ
jgi:prepilin-type N-terminal cleavage/methylation domain-containing protein